MFGNRKKSVRQQLFVDPKVQGTLMIHAVLYWFVCLLALTLLILCWRVLTSPPRPFLSHLDNMWLNFGPAFLASIILLPIVVVDVVRLSNRFAGPLVRLRRGMRSLARGEEVKKIYFRKDDFWQDFADEFNMLVNRMAKLESAETLEEEAIEEEDFEEEDFEEEEPAVAGTQ